MKGMRFNEKLECVIQRALRRLHGRMKYAYLRGELKNYLDKVGLDVRAEEPSDMAGFHKLWETVGVLMTKNIKHARKMGYLRDYMRRIDMSDIIMFPVKRVSSMKLLPTVTDTAISKEGTVCLRLVK